MESTLDSSHLQWHLSTLHHLLASLKTTSHLDLPAKTVVAKLTSHMLQHSCSPLIVFRSLGSSTSSSPSTPSSLSPPQWTEYVSLIMSIPELVANSFAGKVPLYFNLKNYYTELGTQCSLLIQSSVDSLHLTSTSTSKEIPDQLGINMTAELVESMLHLGYGTYLARVFDIVKAMPCPGEGHSDPFLETLQLVFSRLQRALNKEKLLLLLLRWSCSQDIRTSSVFRDSRKLYIIMKKSLQEASWTRYMLIHKLLLAHGDVHPNSCRRWVKVSHFACLDFPQGDLSPLQILSDLAHLWTEPAFVNRASFSSLRKVAVVLLLCIGYLHKTGPDHSKQELPPTLKIKLLSGMKYFLECSTPTPVRQLAMVVAEALSELCDHPEHRLSFELEQNQDILFLRGLVEAGMQDATYSMHDGEGPETMEETYPDDLVASNTQKNLNEETPKCEVNDGFKVLHKLQSLELQSDSDDDEEDDTVFVPFANANEKRQDSIKPPRYIRELLEWLRKYESDPDRISLVLTVAPKLIEKASILELEELCYDYLRSFLSLQNTYELETFTERCIECISSMIQRLPELCAPFVAEQFYDRNYSLSQRLDMISSLCSTALKLSNVEEEASWLLWSRPTDRGIECSKWLQKDKLSTPKKGVRNLFHQVCHHFFYPLLNRGFYGTFANIVFSSPNEEMLLLEKYIMALSLFLYCGGSSMYGPTMCKNMLEFLNSLLAHFADGFCYGVERSILFCLNVVLMKVNQSGPGSGGKETWGFLLEDLSQLHRFVEKGYARELLRGDLGTEDLEGGLYQLRLNYFQLLKRSMESSFQPNYLA